jgi:hypothetical protein
MIGRTFGHRTVIAAAPTPRWHTKAFWRVRCTCGREDEVLGQALRDSKAAQCRDCRAKDFVARGTIHGQARHGQITPEFRIWSGMLARCTNARSPKFKWWGGRGIKVCERWRSFENFFADMGFRPAGKSLDRFPNNDGDYAPDNCRWATPKEQIANQRKHGLIEIFTDEELLTELHRRGVR